MTVLITAVFANLLLAAGPQGPVFIDTTPLAAPQPTDLDSVPAAVPDDDQYDPNMYADSLDTDVAYDDSVAQTYDDGYDPQAYTQFAEPLAPYGSWIDDASYGRVWMPSTAVVGSDFSPYATNGHWVMTEYGWTWVSGWDWGWAPFHYGRWAMLRARGWCWIPGTLWGPAWVSWRWGGGYAGWSPLPPRGIGIGRPIGTRSPWRFTLAAHLGAAHPAFLPARAVPGIFGNTTVVSNRRALSMGGTTVHVNSGPAAGFAGASVGAPTPRLAVVARGAVPRVAIQPHAGIAVSARPWAHAGIREQTPVHRWGVSPMVGARTPAWGAGTQGAVGPQITYPSYVQRPAYRPMPPRSYAPATVSRSYAPPMMRSYVPVAPIRSFAPPAPVARQWTAPAYQAPSFQAPPRHFFAPSQVPSFGHTGSSFGGGGGFMRGGGGHGRR